MKITEKIEIIPRNWIFDSRGSFLKIMNGNENSLPDVFGEFYISKAAPKETRAGHYHNEACEWFTLITGKARLFLEDIQSGDSIELDLSEDSPYTIYVPRRIAHLFVNTGSNEMTVVAYSNMKYNPDDTIPYKFNAG